jgi:hypothetical protein
MTYPDESEIIGDLDEIVRLHNIHRKQHFFSQGCAQCTSLLTKLRQFPLTTFFSADDAIPRVPILSILRGFMSRIDPYYKGDEWQLR